MQIHVGGLCIPCINYKYDIGTWQRRKIFTLFRFVERPSVSFRRCVLFMNAKDLPFSNSRNLSVLSNEDLRGMILVMENLFAILCSMISTVYKSYQDRK